MSARTIVDEMDSEIARLEEARRILSPGNGADPRNGGGAVLRAADVKLLTSIARTPITLPTVFRDLDEPEDKVTSGVSVTAYGQGQLTGVTYTVPAHGEITVDFTLKIQCVTPADIKEMSELIRSLLDASRQSVYEELVKKEITGGASFFGFFSFGASASYSSTKRRMDKWGLSEESQRTIVNAMMQLAQQVNEFKYRGTIYNRENDYSVSGSLFGIVMEAKIQQEDHSNQVRFLAPKPHLQSPDGTTLETLDPLYK
jgi:hypothetical protein